jgi:hypothetical protein
MRVFQGLGTWLGKKLWHPTTRIEHAGKSVTEVDKTILDDLRNVNYNLYRQLFA